MHVYFTEDGQMDKRIFLGTWKDIPTQNEVQYTIQNINSTAGIYCVFPCLITAVVNYSFFFILRLISRRSF